MAGIAIPRPSSFALNRELSDGEKLDTNQGGRHAEEVVASLLRERNQLAQLLHQQSKLTQDWYEQTVKLTELINEMSADTAEMAERVAKLAR